MIDIIPTNKDALKVWLVDLSGNVAVSDAGIGLLDAQFTHLESDCSAAGRRIDHDRANENATRAQPAAHWN
jgi:hypothetical protein